MIEHERSVAGQKISAQTFTFRQMAIATNNFSIENLVGEGGFGRVYKGYIEGVDEVYLFVYSNIPASLKINDFSMLLV